MKSILIFLTCAAALSYGAVVNVSSATETQEIGSFGLGSNDKVDIVQEDNDSLANSSLPLWEIFEARDANTTSSPDAEVTASVILLPSHDTNDTEIIFSNLTDSQTDFKNETRCPPLFFPCSDGTCLPFSYFCDHQPQCPDGSDEDPIFCQQGVPAVICADGLQMLKGHDARCDGLEDCDDGSDERGCIASYNETADNQTTLLKPCSWEYQFQCSEGTCIDKSQVCDGEYDCPLGVDESLAQCALKRILSNLGRNNHRHTLNHDMRRQKAYQCANGDILIANGDIICNGYKDCMDGSDERNCGRKYMCYNGQIIESSKSDIRCDGENDCFDNSDETSCAYSEDGALQVTSQSDKQKMRTYVTIMITLAVCALAFLIIIIAQMRLVCSLRKAVLERERKRPIVLTHATPPPSYSEVTAGNPTS